MNDFFGMSHMLFEMIDMGDRIEEKKESCLQEWKDSANFPRKKKKKARKKILIMYSIWDDAINLFK